VGITADKENSTDTAVDELSHALYPKNLPEGSTPTLRNAFETDRIAGDAKNRLSPQGRRITNPAGAENWRLISAKVY
jgi:hypothetical protein